MYLVGLHIYHKMIHGPYNIKFDKFLTPQASRGGIYVWQTGTGSGVFFS